MSVQCIPPYTPLLYSKTGVCRGIPIFLIFVPKHRLWVLVGSNVYPQSFAFEQKYQKFSVENFPFLKLKKSLCIAWANFRNETQ